MLLVWTDVSIIYYQVLRYLMSFQYFLQYRTTVKTTSSFYFEKKMQAELQWRRRQRVLLFDEVESSSQVTWHDVGMSAAF